MCTEMSPIPVFCLFSTLLFFRLQFFITGCMITAMDQKLEAEKPGNDAMVLPR